MPSGVRGASPDLLRLLIVAAAWSALPALLYIRLPELVAISRSVGAAVSAMVPAVSTSVVALSFLIVFAAMLFGLPAVAFRKGTSKWSIVIAALSSYVALVGICDGPLFLWRPPSPSLHALGGQTILITGGNAGLGFSAAKMLAGHGAKVLLACRSPQRCISAAESVTMHAQRVAGTQAGVAVALKTVLHLDDLDSVRTFASAVAAKEGGVLDGLVLNAGFAPSRRDGQAAVTAQGLERSFGAMHVGHALLAKLLLPALRKGKGRGGSGARVVSVGSEASHLANPLHPSFGTADGEGDLRGEVTNVMAPLASPSVLANLMLDVLPNSALSYITSGSVGFAPTYMRAKYCNVLFSRALKEGRHGTVGSGRRALVSTAVGPGFVHTSIFGTTGMGGPAYVGIELMGYLAMRSSTLGAYSIVRALIDDAGRVDGAFLDSMAIPRAMDESCVSAHGCSAHDAARLATVTERLIKTNGAPPSSNKGISPAVTPPTEAGLALEMIVAVVAIYGLGGAILALVAFAAFGLRREWIDAQRALYKQTGGVPPYGTRVPPGRALNAINRTLHHPLIHPVLSALYWASMAPCAAALSPIVLVDGVINFVQATYARLTDTVEMPAAQRAQHAIVVTGCDTGFGRALAVHLAERGYTVFAGCLKPAALAEEARKNALLLPVAMDVTSDDQMTGGAAIVQAWLDAQPGRRLLSLVNNAGVGTGGFAEVLSMRDFERDSAVNYLGVVRACKAFLPAMRAGAKTDGATTYPRIVVVSSMSGKVPVPLLAPYTSSKHAVMAFAGALRMEMKMFGVHVVTCLPSFHRTPLLTNRGEMLDRVWASAPAEVQNAYGGACHESSKRCCEEFLTDWAWDPERVTEALSACATSLAKLPCELTVGGDARYGLNLMRHLPPAVYEAVVLYWMAWHLIEPEKC